MRRSAAPDPWTTAKRRGPALGLAVLGCGLLLGGCAEVDRRLEPGPINPSSPIASEAEGVSHETFPAPSFRAVPAKWTDAPKPDVFKKEVVREIEERRALEAFWAQHPPDTGDTELWAAEQRNRIPLLQKIPVAPTHDAESEAFAKRLREEAARPQ